MIINKFRLIPRTFGRYEQDVKKIKNNTAFML